MYLDTVIFLALLKPRDRHLRFAQKILKTKELLYTSVATMIELEVVVKRELNDFLSQNILSAVFQEVPNLKIVPLDEKIFSKSLELRKKYGLSIYDSIHAATALTKDKKIASTDHVFERINDLQKVEPQEEESD